MISAKRRQWCGMSSSEKGTDMRSFSAAIPFLVVLFGSFFCAGCDEPEVNSFFQTGTQDRPAPTIASVSPPGLALAGMDSVIVQGTNFSSEATENFLFFDEKKATLLGASGTQLTAIAPLALGDSVVVRVAVLGAIAFSNSQTYSLQAGVTSFGDLLPATSVAPAELASAMATDTAGNLYVAYTYGPSDAGILRFTPDTVRTVYAPATAGVTQWLNLRFGPSGFLYALRSARAIYRFPQGGAAAATPWLTFPAGIFIIDVDFDPDGNMWAAGNNVNIYRILPDKSFTTYPFAGNVRCVRVFDGYLYFAALVSGEEKIWRAPITAGGLGTPEVYFDLSATMPTLVPKSITFATDGTMLVGTNSSAGLLVVNADRSYSSPFESYVTLFPNGLGTLAWGSNTNLYCASANGLLLKFLMRGKTSAPYYGSAL